MNTFTCYDALFIPAEADGAKHHPKIVALYTSPLVFDYAVGHESTTDAEVYRAGRIPHPEVLMKDIGENLGPRGWRYQVLEALEGMHIKLDKPYIIFFPFVSRDGFPFPINQYAQDAQSKYYKEAVAWRGDLIVAKYKDLGYTAMENISMADLPLIKNYLSTSGCNRGLTVQK
ncbi:hypothetical protein NM688_g672 [Phlebia brevispora]|uniref:Uncharacterized protein n=1 Tax=Phlebia brevispora TaxID=194682 RepID=A0ACC1TE01_9APHY|nr:hypothetical protein NM688_g672 [Phlebia brevispora]